jgi:hypothetical protein
MDSPGVPSPFFFRLCPMCIGGYASCDARYGLGRALLAAVFWPSRLPATLGVLSL